MEKAMGNGEDATGQSGGDESARAREVADRLLGQRGHSRSELLGKLTERDFTPEVAEEVCEDLVDEGVLDDRRFAVHQARLLRDQNWGPNQIRRKLRDHGVDDAVCDEALGEVGGEVVWLEHCYARFASKFGSDVEQLSRRDKQKAFRHLKRRGFRGWTARRVVLDGYEPDEG